MHQGCGFHPLSGSERIQELANECINKWNNKLMFLSLAPFLSLWNQKIKKFEKPSLLLTQTIPEPWNILTTIILLDLQAILSYIYFNIFVLGIAVGAVCTASVSLSGLRHNFCQMLGVLVADDSQLNPSLRDILSRREWPCPKSCLSLVAVHS